MSERPSGTGGFTMRYCRHSIGEAGSALVASSLEDLASVRGLHSLHETVLLLSLELLGLISSLHLCYTSFFTISEAYLEFFALMA